jgi:quercetin dioxygenase-like cupin family protein
MENFPNKIDVLTKVVNHLSLEPKIQLTDKISAVEILKPGDKGQMSAHKIWVPANVEYPPHTHPSAHVILVLDGGGYMKLVENEKITEEPLKIGDMFFVPGNVAHQVGADKRGLVMIAISVDSKELTDPDRLKVIDKLL